MSWLICCQDASYSFRKPKRYWQRQRQVWSVLGDPLHSLHICKADSALLLASLQHHVRDGLPRVRMNSAATVVAAG
jgi:hypothetical protein